MPLPPDQTVASIIHALYRLNVGVVGRGATRHERPHKPVLLLAVLDMLAVGRMTPDRISWCPELRARFKLYFDRVCRANDRCTPELPFYHLRQEQWWQPCRHTVQGELTLAAPPSAGDARTGQVFAKIDASIARFLVRPEDRMLIREALASRYFPDCRGRISDLFAEAVATQEQTPPIDHSPEDPEVRQARSSAFRRIILEIYDHQCAACGLRIKLAEIDDLTFVDAAHLIPFSDPDLGGNDHPSNGMALCKNHHWAMDRFLIAPTPEGVWLSSSKLNPLRSEGEKALVSLSGQAFPQPAEQAFHPAPSHLQWRLDRLLA